MSYGFRLTFIWLLGGTIALLAALSWLPSVFYQGEILPAGHDSFYHARRMLDAVSDPSGLMQFDPRIHAPEGSWVPWPWGYDYLMAWTARLGVMVNENLQPLTILVYVPAVWTFMTAALVLGVATTLGLNLWLRLAAVLCFALSPLTQDVHGIGRVDHHFFEYTFVLLALLTGLRWLGNIRSARDAALCGLVLGVACAFHNGLFILQIPLVGAVTLMWLKGVTLPGQSAVAFAGAIVAATILAVVPSAPFRAGMFTYDLLSWFHLYTALCTATWVLLLQRSRRSRSTLVALAVVAIGMLTPLLAQLRSGLGFVAMEIVELNAMPETRSVFGGTGAKSMSWQQAWQEFSGLVLLLPAIMLASAWLALRASDPKSLYFYVFTVFGGALLLVQYRFHVFGSFALYLPLLAWCQYALDNNKSSGYWVVGGLSALLLTAYAPAVKTLGAAPAPGYSYDYVVTRSVYPPLADACVQEPGVVLADHNDGHYIRFHTECAVIANNLILSRQSREKIRQTREFFQLEPAELRRIAPWVRYVFVKREDNVFTPGITESTARNAQTRLGASLLFGGPPYPAGYRLLHQVVVETERGEQVVVARVFQIEAHSL